MFLVDRKEKVQSTDTVSPIRLTVPVRCTYEKRTIIISNRVGGSTDEHLNLHKCKGVIYTSVPSHHQTYVCRIMAVSLNSGTDCTYFLMYIALVLQTTSGS